MKIDRVTIHVWHYGTELWTEVDFEGEDIEKLKTLIGRPNVDDSVHVATGRVFDGLSKLGVVYNGTPDVQFHDESKRRPRLAQLVIETGGEFDQDGISVYYGGACPVQGQGTIDGHPFYYRARGRGWELDVFERDAVLDEDDWPEPIFSLREKPYAHPDGGWLEASESKTNILKAAEAFRARNKETPCEPKP